MQKDSSNSQKRYGCGGVGFSFLMIPPNCPVHPNSTYHLDQQLSNSSPLWKLATYKTGRPLLLLSLRPFHITASARLGKSPKRGVAGGRAHRASPVSLSLSPSFPTCYCYSTADAEEATSLVLATMEKPKKDTILQFLMIMIGWIQSVRTLECYDSSYPVPHRRTECGPNMVNLL